MQEPTWITVFKLFTELLRIGVWPIITVIIVCYFRNEIRELSRRLTHAKVAGQEADFGRSEDLTKLNQDAEQAASVTAEVVQAPQTDEQQKQNESAPKIISVQESLKTISEPREPLSQISDPEKGTLKFLQLHESILQQLREINAGFRTFGTAQQRLAYHALEELEIRGQIPRALIVAVREFLQFRNRVVHGRWSTEELLQIVDSGETILRSLKAVPRMVPTVYRTHIPIWKDRERRSQWPGWGVIVTVESEEGTPPLRQIYPTTRSHFKEGMRVAWEWSPENQWGEAWYLDPDTNTVKGAWSGSMEFVGRALEDIPV